MKFYNQNNLLPNTYRLKPCRGFTLIELLVSVAIIGMLSTLVVANLRSRNPANAVDGEARKFISLVQQTRSRAISGIDPRANQPLSIQEQYGLMIQGNMYRVFVDSSLTGTLGIFNGNEALLEQYTMPSGVALATQPSANTTVIDFKTDSGDMLFGSTCTYAGLPNPSPSLSVIFSSGTYSKTVVVKCMSGSMTVQ